MFTDLTLERFASTRSFLSTAPELQDNLRNKLKIPAFFFDKMHLQLNGFRGYDVRLDANDKIEFYSMYY